MPGIVGMAGAIESDRMRKALDKIAYLAGYETVVFPIAQCLTLGFVGRPSQRGYEASQGGDRPGLSVLVYGTVLRQDPRPHRVSARQVLEDYQRDGFKALREAYDGSFVIVVVDQDKRRLHVANDRVGTQPLYYRNVKGGGLAFGPEVKALLTVAGADAELCEAGLVNLLLAGYNLGDRTLFADVRALEPGTLLTHDLSSHTTSCERYWKIVYEVEPAFRRRAVAAQALFESVQKAHQLQLADAPREYDLFLSGGLDSRAILGVLDQLGSKPRRALGWGLRDDIPGSDVWIARQLAREFQLGYDFLQYDTDRFVGNASDWVYVSELANDNFGRYGEGLGAIQNFYSTGADFTLIGDEGWGWHGYAGDETEARAQVLPSPVSPRFRSILRGDRVDQLLSLYNESVDGIMRPCENTDPTDRKDFLYLHGRVARFIFSLGYYREIASEMRRPFLANGVLEVVRHLPKESRVHKNLYVSMLHKFLPRTMRFPDMEAASLPDWTYDVRYKEPLRGYILELLDFSNLEDGPLGAMIDRTAFERLRDEAFSCQVLPLPRRSSAKFRWMRAIHQALVRRPSLERLLRRVRKNQAFGNQQTGRNAILWRIALCVLLQRNLGRFTS